MPPTIPNPAFLLHGYFPIDPGIIESPPALRIEPKFSQRLRESISGPDKGGQLHATLRLGRRLHSFSFSGSDLGALRDKSQPTTIPSTNAATAII
jgi:hypothetical protein